jgi:hypothetical protein
MYIRSGRNASFYFSQFFILLLSFGLGTLLVFVATSKETDYTMIAFALVFFGLGIYSVYAYTMKTPVITFSDDGIQFNGRTYFWSQLQNVKLDCKEPFRFLWTAQQMDAIVLYFDDGTTHTIYVKMQRNIPEVRSAITAKTTPNAIIDTAPTEEEIKMYSSPQLKRAAGRIKYYMFGYIAFLLILGILTAPINGHKQTGLLQKILLVTGIVAGAIGLSFFVKREIRKAKEDYSRNQ